VHIRAADGASFDPDPDLARPRIRIGAFLEAQRLADAMQYHCLHGIVSSYIRSPNLIALIARQNTVEGAILLLIHVNVPAGSK
jgi:hypothetical protein